MTNPIFKSIAELITGPKGLSWWYDNYWSICQYLKTHDDAIGNLSVGSAPGVFAPYDTRFHVVETGFAANAYTAALSPVATGQAIPTGYAIRFVPTTTNTGTTVTLDVGSTDGAVAVKKYSSGSKVDLAIGDLVAGRPEPMMFDGTHWVAFTLKDVGSHNHDSDYQAKTLSRNGESGTSYTIQSSDAGNYIVCTNASAVTITLNPGTLLQGQWVTIMQSGDGQVTLVGGTVGSDDVNLQVPSTLSAKTKEKYSLMTVLVQDEAGGDEWAVVTGHLAAA